MRKIERNSVRKNSTAIVILAVLSLFGVVDKGLASEARTRAMGQPAGIQDETRVFRFPSTMSQFSLAMIELGTADGKEAYGGFIKSWDTQSFGLIMSRTDFLMTDPGLATLSLVDNWLAKGASNTDKQSILPSLDRAFELLYSFDTTDKYSLGFYVGYADFHHEQKTTTGTRSLIAEVGEQLDLGLGLTLGRENSTDISLKYGLLGKLEQAVEADSNRVKHTFARNNPTTLSIRHRRLQGEKDIIYTEWHVTSREATATEERSNQTYRGTFEERLLQVEGGYISKTRPGALIVGALGGIWINSSGPLIADGTGVASDQPAQPSLQSTANRLKRIANWVYGSIGFESAINDRWGLLGGVNYVFWGASRTEDNLSSGEPESTASLRATSDSNLWSMGLSFEEEVWRMDATFAKALLYNGPHFISGSATPNPLTRISLTYKL